jgi:ATP-dependent Zn protease
VIVLGGVAAEVFVFGRAKVASAATDLLRARDLAGQIARARVAAPWAPSAARDGAAMPFKDLYKPPLKKVELEIIDQGYRMARSILVRREESYQRLVARLTGYRTLDAGDLLAMLGDRRDIFGAAGSRATFVTG